MSAVSTSRLFIALDLPDPLREQLAAMRGPVSGLVWSRPEQMHLTLRFLGDVDIALREPLESALARVNVEPFMLPVAGVGSFPPRRPARVLWVGVGRGHPRLHQLRQQIDDNVLHAGVALDVRHFHPHVTLARVKPGAASDAAAAFLKRHREFETAPFRVTSFVLYASELSSAGARHTPWRTFPLTEPVRFPSDAP